MRCASYEMRPESLCLEIQLFENLCESEVAIEWLESSVTTHEADPIGAFFYRLMQAGDRVFDVTHSNMGNGQVVGRYITLIPEALHLV